MSSSSSDDVFKDDSLRTFSWSLLLDVVSDSFASVWKWRTIPKSYSSSERISCIFLMQKYKIIGITINPHITGIVICKIRGTFAVALGVFVGNGDADGVLVRDGDADGVLVRDGDADGVLVCDADADGVLVRDGDADGVLVETGVCVGSRVFSGVSTEVELRIGDKALERSDMESRILVDIGVEILGSMMLVEACASVYIFKLVSYFVGVSVKRDVGDSDKVGVGNTINVVNKEKGSVLIGVQLPVWIEWIGIGVPFVINEFVIPSGACPFKMQLIRFAFEICPLGVSS